LSVTFNGNLSQSYITVTGHMGSDDVTCYLTQVSTPHLKHTTQPSTVYLYPDIHPSR